jgi:protein-disulfide isomerase
VTVVAHWARVAASFPVTEDTVRLLFGKRSIFGLLGFVLASLIFGVGWSSSIHATAIPPSLSRGGRRLGSIDAPLTVHVYGDFVSSAYAHFAVTTLPQIVTDYVNTGKVQIQLHYTRTNDPALALEGEWAAKAAECAAQQDLFWPYHAKLVTVWLESVPSLYSQENLLRYAKEAGLDVSIFDRCLSLDKTLVLVQQYMASTGALKYVAPTVSVMNTVAPPDATDYLGIKEVIDGLAKVR